MQRWFILVLFLFLHNLSQGQVVKIVTEEFPPQGTVTKDTVYYSKTRKLQWSDFTAKDRAESTMAAVSFTGFSYNASFLEKQDTTFIHIYLQVYFDRNGSWVRQGDKSSYALAHEQLHFDIAKLMEEQFKDSLHLKTFDPEYYAIEIHWLYWDYWRKMNRIQKKYDTETRNGRNQGKQAQWMDKIKKALSAK